MRPPQILLIERIYRIGYIAGKPPKTTWAHDSDGAVSLKVREASGLIAAAQKDLQQVLA